jgi:hypothetical protein
VGIGWERTGGSARISREVRLMVKLVRENMYIPLYQRKLCGREKVWGEGKYIEEGKWARYIKYMAGLGLCKLC